MLQFIGILALICLGVFLWIKYTHHKEKKRFDAVVKKAKSLDDKPAESDTAEGASSKDSKPQIPLTKKWQKQIEPLKQATQRIGLAGLKMMQAHVQHNGLLSKRQEAGSRRDSIASSTSMTNDKAKLERQLGEFVRLQVIYIDSKLAENEAKKDLEECLKAAKSAQENLSSVLKSCPTQEPETAPRKVKPLLLIALRLQAHYQTKIKAIEEILEENPLLEVPENNRFPLSKYEAKIAEIGHAIVETFALGHELQLSMSSAQTTISALDYNSLSIGREPVKPTEEEVIQFLRRIEKWAEGTLAKRRATNQGYVSLAETLKRFEAALKKLKKLQNKLPSCKKTDGDKEYLAARVAIEHLVSKVDTLLISANSKVSDFVGVTRDPSETKEFGSTDEDEKCEAIWSLARKLGYAIAQKNSAKAKLNSHWSKASPSTPNEPKVLGDFDLERLLQEFESYISACEKAAEVNDVLEAQAEVIDSAVQARAEKVGQVASDLLNLAQTTEKQIRQDSCCQLRIRVIMTLALAGHYKTKS